MRVEDTLDHSCVPMNQDKKEKLKKLDLDGDPHYIIK